MEWYYLINFRSKRCAYTYMCGHVCMTCFRITTLSKHVGISLTQTWSMHQKDLMRHFLLCINSKNRMQHVPEHTYMIKKNVWKNIRKQLYALIFKKQRDSINISSSSSVYFPFRRPFSKPNPPGFKNRLVSDVIAWGESLRHTRRGNPPSKTWDLSLRVRLFARGNR